MPTKKKPNPVSAVGRQLPITEQRKRVFLATLRETGSTYAAARAATPWSRDKVGGGYSSFLQLAKRDPLFAEEWKRAEEEFLGVVESEIVRRAMQPSERSVVVNGKVVAKDKTYDNKLLMFLVERVHPEKWARREKLEVSGTVDHRHAHLGIGVTLSADDLYLLPDDRREQLLGLITELTETRERLEAQTARPETLPALVDQRPAVAAPTEAETDNG